MLLRHPDRPTLGMISGNPPDARTFVNPDESVPICYVRNMHVNTIWSRFEPTWPAYRSPEAPSERNPSELSGELDRDEEQDVDFEILPETGDPTKEQREEEGRPPKAIELDLSVLPDTKQCHPCSV
jgi:hypothetical protein